MAGGWGNNPWGSFWGSSGEGAEENIPYTDEWDIFDLSGVRQPNDMDRVQVFVEVESLGDGAQFFIASFNIASGGSYPTDTGVLLIDRAVTEDFTIQYDVTFQNLPLDFDNVVERHAFLGAWSSQDYAVGFFFSRAGVQYTGNLSIDGGGNIVVEQDQQDLPGSAGWVEEGVEYIIRVAVNSSTQLVYLFITKKEDIEDGAAPILRAILVARETTSLANDNIQVSVRGTALEPSWIEFFNYQMSSKFLVSNLAPIAIAGDDQAARRCGIIQLDGSQSFDPEGQALTYEWRLIDAPQGSMFIVEAVDGVTQPESPATGFTNRFYSDTLAQANDAEPILPGDVITLIDGSFTITGTGTESGNFYVDVEYDQIKDSYTGVAFKMLRQAGISGPTTVKPTFYPDVLGFYSFDLRVSDGELSSSPLGLNRSKVLINVVESPLPRACSVDAGFMFDYMLSYWKLVEDRERIATYFEGVSRVAASELYTLWQLEYSKSLRDIQRTFIRRWLHYDLLLPEPIPEITTLRTLWSGVRSNPLSGDVRNITNSQLVVTSPRLADPVTILLSSPSPAGPERYARELQVRLRDAVDPSFAALVAYDRGRVATSTDLSTLTFPSSVAGLTLTVAVDGGIPETVVIGTPANLDAFVAEVAAGLTNAAVGREGVTLRINSLTAGEDSSVEVVDTSTILTLNGGPIAFTSLTDEAAATIYVTAEVPFTLTSLSNAPGFSYPVVNSLIGGVGGQKMAERTFRASFSLAPYSFAEDDLLVIDRQAYRVVRVVDDPIDPFPFQRVVVKDPLPASLDPANSEALPPEVEWAIPGWVQSELLNFYNGLVDRGDHVDFEAIFDEGNVHTTELVETIAIGVSASIPNRLGIDTAQLAQVTTGTESALRLARVLRRHYMPIDSRVEDVPILSPVISVEDPDTVLRRNVDFFLEEFRGRNSLRFSAGVGAELGDVWEAERPPDRMWAEYTYFNNEDVIEANFGEAIGLTRDKVPDNVNYLSAVRGIWYALYNGPTVRNLRIATQIFLGLPFAEVAGTIEEIRTDFFSQRSRILIRDTDNPEIVRSYVYPRVLDVEVNPDTGVTYVVGDTVSEFAPLVTGAEVTDWVKDPTWFQGIVNQGIFVEPQKYHTFLVRVDSDAFNLDSLVFAQDFIKSVKPVYTDPLYVVLFRVSGDGDEIDVIDTIEYKVTLHIADSMCDRMGASSMFDQSFPGGTEYGWEWRNRFDNNDDPTDADPTYPGPSDAVQWGFDKEWLCPESDVQISSCEDYVAEVPRFDSIWKYDTGAMAQLMSTVAGPFAFPHDFSLGNAPSDTTISKVFLQLNGETGPITEGDWVIEVVIAGAVEASIPLELGRLEWQMPGPTQVLVVTMERNIDVAAVVSVAVTTGQSIAIRVRPVSGSAQNPTWSSFNIAVSYQVLWTFDSGPVTGTFCAEMENDQP